MSATDPISVGDPLPRIAAVEPGDGPLSVVVSWAEGSRAGRTETIDLAPMILTFKVLRPLRNDAELFRTVRLGEDGWSLVWAGNPDLDIGADSLEDLAEEVCDAPALTDAGLAEMRPARDVLSTEEFAAVTSVRQASRGRPPLAAWDVVDHLDTPERIALYIEAVLEDGDPGLIASAIGDVARARGMAQIAEETGLSRESLYRALSERGNPQLTTLVTVLKAIGLRLSVKLASPA